ncbi:transcription factor IBH1-like 1 [Euphorbia lathyris]|uniref:transcription factor IBH1-like 1 n=1 Tax=Euphorbia lathyris TaxID=212925 RepID=UPI0033132D35
MRSCRSSLRVEILKKWILGLKVIDSAKTKKKMNITERKKAIKLSADIAMASTKNGRTCWSRAILAKATKDEQDKRVVQQILASDHHDEQIEKSASLNKVLIRSKNKRVRSKKILNKSRVKRISRRSSNSVAKSVAKMLVKNRTKVLKSLVPGGEFMDDIYLVQETLDYIVSLQAQVDVMRTLANATDLLRYAN